MDRLAEALRSARRAADSNGAEIIRSDQITRSERELLLQNQWIEEIIRGWYLLGRPDIRAGDSSRWYAHFWDFLALYLHHRFGREYCLSAESSLDVHSELSSIPHQVIVIVPKGGGKPIELPYETSAYLYTDLKNLPQEREERRKLQVMPLELALAKVSPTYFKNRPSDAQIALQLCRSPHDLAGVLLAHRLTRAAGRLVAAYRSIGEEEFADTLREELIRFGSRPQESNPFEEERSALPRAGQPHVTRLQALWQEGRLQLFDHFPPPPGLPPDPKTYMDGVDRAYERDAYNSLSIEGYRVSPELIQRVMSADWNPDDSLGDSEDRNALAARGYLEAHQKVELSLLRVLRGENSGLVASEDLQNWYHALFSPSLQAGILSPGQLAGYRRHPVYIRNSRHIPPPHKAVVDCMETLFGLLADESEAAVRAVLGHYFFVFIHPYMDGNGRIGRFLMNLMLASGGYPWTVIQLENRRQYLEALSQADHRRDFLPLADLIESEMAL